ncbi:MAG TPA: hydrogen peroxide-dependent heme synthase [Longimicrobiales bacterium]|nr:hydrogen peroxide-dependent heme synthase [Longimicrobiales bacterium]
MSELPPASVEGWYVLHQMFAIDWTALRALDASAQAELAAEAADLMAALAKPEEPGWSAGFRLVGGGADVMLVHFRETLDALSDVELRIKRSRPGTFLRSTYEYTSVTEAGMYSATAKAAAEAEPRSKEYDALLAEMVAAERASPHLRTRLFPEVPEGMRYVSFYPMNKRRTHPDNWYGLPVAERNRLMREHGLSGRRYAGRIFQVITGSVGFDDWEWGVTLFAHDPLDFKRIVTEMRYDEASTRYGEFGEFFVGMRIDPADWKALFSTA